ncbi:SNF2, N-terminal [Dillenia turbinata]|uniref:SNF2, N-terminal n=1 Tax=Dillenia turbinata TaxID=194707 RepID=A0AAN8VLP2_9MAGN
MAAMEPINISSSTDSDFDIDLDDDSDLGGSSATSPPRILPSWASSAPSTSPQGHSFLPTWNFLQSLKLLRMVTFRLLKFAGSGAQSQNPTLAYSSRLTHPNSREDVRPSNQQKSWQDQHFAENGNAGQSAKGFNMSTFRETSNFEKTGFSGADFSSQQASKRALPPSLGSYELTNKPKHSMETMNRSQIHDTLEKSSHFSPKNYPQDQIIRVNDDDVFMHESSKSRVLPPSLMHGKSISYSQYATPSDTAYRSGIGIGAGDERAVGTDERLIYQAALQTNIRRGESFGATILIGSLIVKGGSLILLLSKKLNASFLRTAGVFHPVLEEEGWIWCDLNQPKVEVDVPDGLLSVPLLRHQKIALAWMLQKEMTSLHCLGGILADDQGLGKTVSMIALIQIQKSLQSKSKENDGCNHKTEALNLDDDDENNDGAKVIDSKQTGESDDGKIVTESSASAKSFNRHRPAAGTLIVCPASILRQWSRELEEKAADDAKLSVLIYHGTRTKDPLELAKYDVVLTTYSIVTNEVPKQPLVDEEDADQKNGEQDGISAEFLKKKKASNVSKKRKKGRKGIDDASIDSGPLAKVGWFRVILDEAQTIKNHRTQVARACCGLRAKRRWCLSGTPIQNAIDDLYSYFRFLRYDPYAVYKSFCNTLKNPISRNTLHGYKKLQAVLRAVMLRRTKGTLIDGEPIINLPPKTILLSRVDFSPEERAFYNKLETETRSQFKEYAAAGTLTQNYANILLMLLRLRQACDHPLLVKGYSCDSVRKNSSEMARRLPREMIIHLLSLLETSSAICAVCNDPPEDAIVTMCGHVFCFQCVSEYLSGDDQTCPAPHCKDLVGPEVAFSKATLRSCISDGVERNPFHSSEHDDNSIVLQNEYSSAKIRAALDILQNSCGLRSSDFKQDIQCNRSSPRIMKTECCYNGVNVATHTTVYMNSEADEPIKAIVFSQWTRMLDLVETSLNQHLIQYRRLDGTMPLSARDKAVKDFNADPEVIVMLMSLKAGNLGLNMVAACHVIMLDLWWNPTTEDQAVDRAHRIGQTRPVTVSRITIKDTVEDRILALQIKGSRKLSKFDVQIGAIIVSVEGQSLVIAFLFSVNWIAEKYTEEKRKLVASAFGEDQGGGAATRLTVEDLKYLFMV